MEEEARAWWGQREARAEAELAGALQRRVEAQRAQVLAFKTEQSKWEHELQVGRGCGWIYALLALGLTSARAAAAHLQVRA